ncbi:aquaporin [Klebsiella pneumoniae subsp. pneumoniae]|nr:aquaporin [Klebsiella pneumoniae subsp. pneumoniae]
MIGASMGPLTGFAMNPARDIGPKAFAWLAGWGDVAFTGRQRYSLFPWCRCAHRGGRRGAGRIQLS